MKNGNQLLKSVGKAIAAPTIIGTSLGVTSALASNKLKKKKEEKTAFDIVNETFEKITR